MQQPDDDVRAFLESRERPAYSPAFAGVLAILWGFLLGLCVVVAPGGPTPPGPGFDLSGVLLAVGVAIALLVVRSSFQSAGIVTSACRRELREQLHLAGLSPHACLVARLRPITLAHRAWVLIAGWPFLVLAGLSGFGCIFLPLALLLPLDPDAPYERFAIPLFFLVGAGAIWFAFALARGAVDEMTIHGCPDSRSGAQSGCRSYASATSIPFRGVSFAVIGSLIAGAGLGCLARSAFEFMMIGPPRTFPLSIPLPQGQTHIYTVSIPSLGTPREALIYCLVGVALLAPLAWRMRARRALARERMDAMG